MGKLWKDILEEFKESTGISKEKISDYRPYLTPYSTEVLGISAPGIIVWLSDGSTIIYISKETAL